MKKPGFILFFLFSLAQCKCQLLHYPVAIPYLEVASAIPQFSDALSTFSNPSLIGQIGWHAAGYAEKRYLLNDLKVIAAGVSVSGSDFSCGIQTIHSGNLTFNETHIGIQYGRSFGSFSAGVLFSYSIYTVKGFQSERIAGFGMASTWKLSDRLYSSVQVINPPFSRLHSGLSEKESSEYRFGLMIQASDLVCISIESIKRQEIPLHVIVCLCYQVSEKCSLKAGWTTSGPQPYVGFSWKIGLFRIGMAVTYHPVLGSSPAMIFNYDPEELKKEMP